MGIFKRRLKRVLVRHRQFRPIQVDVADYVRFKLLANKRKDTMVNSF